MQELIDKVNAANPDFIVITGDIADVAPNKYNRALDLLKKLKAKYAILGVPGNHEYYGNSYDKWLKVYKMLGIDILENDARSFEIDNHYILFTGTTDERAGKANLKMPDYQEALNKLGNISSKPVIHILLKHRPQIDFDSHKVIPNLVLSGHTHGGMVPLVNILAKIMNDGYLSGWYSNKEAQVFVSDGTYLWCGFPFRFGTKNSIEEFEISY